MTGSAHVAVVRDLWAAFHSGGVDAVLALTDPDVEWVPYSAGGATLHGHEALRRLFAGLRDRGQTLHARPEVFEVVDDAVVVTGSMRIESWNAVKDLRLHWVFTFRNGRVARAQAFTRREQALAAATGTAPAT